MNFKCTTLFFLLVLNCSAKYLYSQTIEELMTKTHPTCSEMLKNAMDILPELYREKSFDSLHKAFEIWERSCSAMPEVKITGILLHMEESKFILSRDVDSTTIGLLSNYARFFPSPDKIQIIGSYNESQVLFYKFSSAWSRILLRNKKLDENEKFICRVLIGEIKNPQKEIRQNPGMYPELSALLEKNFEMNRKGVRLNLAFSTGVWLPTKNLSVLGVHPSFGLHIGAKNERHQLDLTLQIRYLNSPNVYVVKKAGYPDSTNYYFGGYIGADYTYYLVSKTRFDIGLVAGVGWDGFDFAEQPYDYYYPYHSQVTIGSFNANAGLRFNYYLTHFFYIGLLGRYNGINYSTHGGTNLSGDAVSIDLILGFYNARTY